MRIDLNLDAGEGFGIELEAAQWVSSFNLSLGAHAGTLQASTELAKQLKALGKGVGLHPGYPDRAGFGRRSPSPDEISAWRSDVLAQLEDAFPADYVKFHGALYHDSQRDAEWLRPVIQKLGLTVLGLAGTEHETLGVRLYREGFCERGYRGSHLIPRGEPGATLTDLTEICEQAVRLAANCDSICIHGDNPQALTIAEAVQEALIKEGYTIAPFAV